VLKNKLFLVIGLQDDRVLVKAAESAHELDAAHKENSNRDLIAPDRVEINILDVLRLAYHREPPQKD
jgi:hypothetical protein